MDLTSTTSDTELVHYIQHYPARSPGSQAAIGMLYDRHQARIFRYLSVRLSDPHLAEDLTGDVFMRMVASLPTYQDKELPFQAWLYRIAHNLLVDLHRRRRFTTVQLEAAGDCPADEQDPKAYVEDRLAFQEVRQALQQMDPQQREVILLRFLAGLPIKEVALILNKSVPAIKALQSRGLLCLREMLETAG